MQKYEFFEILSFLNFEFAKAQKFGAAAPSLGPVPVVVDLASAGGAFVPVPGRRAAAGRRLGEVRSCKKQPK